ncbi:hypothetical protein FPHOBKDP_00169 [Listeria phage LPJP1]|nr:hypothetical protein FPHOBKDP_00169 [Listeria phage LPJP1]
MEEQNKPKFSIDPELIDEYNMLKKELSSIDELYTYSEGYFDRGSKAQNSRMKTDPRFVTDQTSNLISLKTMKMQLIKAMSDLKVKMADIKIKEYNINNKDSDINGDQSLIIKGIVNELLNTNRKDLQKVVDENLENDNNEDNENEVEEQDYDKLIEERLNAIKNNDAKKSVNEKGKKTESVVIVEDDSENFVDYLESIGYVMCVDINTSEPIFLDEDQTVYSSNEMNNEVIDSYLANNRIIESLYDEDDNEVGVIFSDNSEFSYVEIEE